MKAIFENEEMEIVAQFILRNIAGCLPDLMGGIEENPAEWEDEISDFSGDYIHDHAPNTWTEEDRDKLHKFIVKYYCGGETEADCTFPPQALERNGRLG